MNSILIQFLLLFSLSFAQRSDVRPNSDEEFSQTADQHIDYPSDKAMNLPIISDIQNLFKTTKAIQIEVQKEWSRQTPKPNTRPPVTSITESDELLSVTPIDDLDHLFVSNPALTQNFNPDPNYKPMDDHWDNPSNPREIPKPQHSDKPNKRRESKPQRKPDNRPPWADTKPYTKMPSNMPLDDPDFPFPGGVIPPPSQTYPGRQPNTIQEWMNENRPMQKPFRPQVIPELKPIQSNRPTDNISNQRPPGAQDYNNGKKPNQLNPLKQELRPTPQITPSYQPPPWERPQPNGPSVSNPNSHEDWWEDRPVRPVDIPVYDESHHQWAGSQSNTPEKPKHKPNLNPNPNPLKPFPDIPLWGTDITSKPKNPSKPFRPKPEPEPQYKPSPQVHKPVKPESMPEWTGNPNLPVWWNDKPSRPESEPEPNGDISGWGGNIFGDNTANGIGGMGDTNGIGGAVIGNNSGNGEGGVGNQNGIGGNIIDDNGANGVGGVGNDNGRGGFVVGNNSGNGKGGVGNSNGIGGNKGGKNSANGTGGVGNNNGKGGLIIGNNSGNGVGGVNQNQQSFKP